MTNTLTPRVDLQAEADRLLASLTTETVEVWLPLSLRDAREFVVLTAQAASTGQSDWIDWRVEAVGEAIRITPVAQIIPLPQKPANLSAPIAPSPKQLPIASSGKFGQWRLLIGAPPESPIGDSDREVADYNFRLAAWRSGDPDPWGPFPSEDADRPNDAILRTIAAPGEARHRAGDPLGVAQKINAWAEVFRELNGKVESVTRDDYDAAFATIKKIAPKSEEEKILWKIYVDERSRLETQLHLDNEREFNRSSPDIHMIQGDLLTYENEAWRDFFCKIVSLAQEVKPQTAESKTAEAPKLAFAGKRTLSAQATTLCEDAIRLVLGLYGQETAQAFAAELSTRIFDAPDSPFTPADAPLAALAALAALPEVANEEYSAIRSEIQEACAMAWGDVSPLSPRGEDVPAEPVADSPAAGPLAPLSPLIDMDGRKYILFEGKKIPWLDETLYDSFVERWPANLHAEDAEDYDDWRPGDGAAAVASLWGVIDPWRTGPTEEAELALRVAVARRMTRNPKGKSLAPEEAAREVAREPAFPANRILPLISDQPSPSIRAEVVHGIWKVGETNFRVRKARRT